MKSVALFSLLLLAAVCISLFATPNASSQSLVTTTTTISQPATGHCSELSLAFLGQSGKEVAGTFGADASISFFILSPSDFMAIRNPTCTLPASSRPLYSQLNVPGYGNSYRSLPFPANGTYYFVFVLQNSGISQLAGGYASVQLTFPASTTLFTSAVSSASSSTSIALTTSATNTTQSESLASTAASTGLSFGTFGIIGVIVVVALVASIMVLMKRGKGPGGEQKPVMKQETVQEEVKPRPKPEDKTEVLPEVKPEAKPEAKAEVVSEISPPKPASTAGNIPTGYPELDSVLAGGLPINYAVLIVSPPCDERDLLFMKIIESSLAMGSSIFFLSRDLIRTQDFANKYQKDFHVFSPQADKLTSAGGKVYKIQGLQNLSDLNISFTKAVEELPKTSTSKLVIIDLLSDVLLQHKALTTRKWLDGFIGKRKTEGFTVIGVLNPLISTQQDTQTITDLFDGIIEIYERELKERARRFLIVRKMYGRRYADTELMLDKDKLY